MVVLGGGGEDQNRVQTTKKWEADVHAKDRIS